LSEYKDHPLAAIFPLMEPSELKELGEDIRRNTQRAPITLYENKILDGRNRYRACLSANVEPKTRQYTGGDPLGFVISANLKRKHLDESQRAMVAARLVTMQNGGDRRSDQSANLPSEKSNSQAAKELSVSERTVRTAKTVLREAPKRIIKAVEQGKKTVSAAAKEIKAKAKTKTQHHDKTGHVIPEEILSDWREAESMEDLLKQVHRIKLKVEKALEDRELVFREITNSTVADLQNAWSALQGLIPYAVCPTCEGINRANCTLCKQRGFLSKFAYEHYVPKKTRDVREAKSA